MSEKSLTIAGETKMDENKFTGWTEDKSGTCYSDDSIGEDVWKKQNGGH